MSHMKCNARTRSRNIGVRGTVFLVAAAIWGCSISSTSEPDAAVVEPLPDGATDAAVDAPDDTRIDPDASSDAAVDAAADADGASAPWSLLVGRPVDIEANSVDSHQCRTIQVTREMNILGFRTETTGPARLQRLVLKVSDSAPQIAPQQLDSYFCNPATAGYQGIYVAGPGMGDLDFPQDVGVRLKVGQYVTMILHMFNESSTLQKGEAQVLVRTGPAASITSEAEMFLIGTSALNIPSDNQLHSYVATCAFAGADAQAAFIRPTMNRLGTKLSLTVDPDGAPAAHVVVSVAPYQVDNRPLYPMNPPLALKATDALHLECQYRNNTGVSVGYGDATTDEQCEVAVYSYPKVGAGREMYSCYQ